MAQANIYTSAFSLVYLTKVHTELISLQARNLSVSVADGDCRKSILSIEIYMFTWY